MPDKPKLTEPATGTIREERSSDFRAGLFSKLSVSKSELRQTPKIFGDSTVTVGGNVPSAMRLSPADFGGRTRGADKISDSFIGKTMSKVTADVEKMVAIIDDRAHEGTFKGSVSAESFKRSIYGRFSDTYKRLKQEADPDQLSVIMSTTFKGSNILTHAEGLVLYFNLPLSETWLPKPKKIFPVNDKPENFTIKDLLYEFERSNNNNPNIILVQNESRDEKFGGFASESWSSNKPYFNIIFIDL